MRKSHPNTLQRGGEYRDIEVAHTLFNGKKWDNYNLALGSMSIQQGNAPSVPSGVCALNFFCISRKVTHAPIP